MLFWSRFPFIRITILFASGIYIGDQFILSLKILYVITIACLFLHVIVSRNLIKKAFRKYNYTLSFIAFLSILFLGILMALSRKPAAETLESIQEKHPFEYYLIQISDIPGNTEKYQKVIGNIKLVKFKDQAIYLQAKILLYIPKDTFIEYGDQLVISGNPSPFSATSIPYEFDYRAYMHKKGFFFNHFLTDSDFILLKNKKPFIIQKVAFSVRSKIIDIIHDRIDDNQVKALLIALTTGKRNYFDDYTYNQFLGAGIVHILAVSGLHVGIIYVLLMMITRPLSYNQTGRMLRLFIIIFSFLFFALITGLSASVLRSVVMFSIILISKSLDRNTHILNSVFLSAFILLCYDPGLLFQVSFQLSYSAVMGIILFQPIIQSLINTKMIVTNWLWNLLSVSISAQLATLPFSLYYFKQFPTYFFISNLFAIPFATIFLPGGIVLSLTYFFPKLNIFIASILEFIGKLFIYIIQIVNQLPGSLIYPINIRLSDALLLVFILFVFFLLFNYKKPKLIKFVLVCVGFMVLRDAIDYFPSSGDKGMIVYTLPDIFCIELIDGHQSLVILGVDDKKNIDKFNHYAENYHIRKNLDFHVTSLSEAHHHVPCYIKNGNHLIVWNNKMILITSSKMYKSYREKISYPFDVVLFINDLTCRPEIFDVKSREIIHENNIKGHLTGKNGCQKAPRIERLKGMMYISF